MYSVEPLYEEHLGKADPDVVFDQSLVGAWGQMDNDCLWILTIKADDQAYALNMSPAPECKSEEKPSRYEGHLVRLESHRFLDIASLSDEVCELCLPLHTFLLVSQENDILTLIPIDQNWMAKALNAKKVILAHLPRQNAPREVLTDRDAVVLTASSKELKAFVSKYGDDKAAFKLESDAKLRFKRRQMEAPKPPAKGYAPRPFCAIMPTMPAAPGATKAVGMVPDEQKFEPKSKGLATPRKKKPKELAVITECCTGCAGSPACVEYCPVEDCMFWVPDEDHPPFGRIADRSHSLHRLQEVPEQRPRWLLPRWLSVGCHRYGRHG